jgi:hypothetical protein
VCIYGFRVVLRVYSDCFLKQHQSIGTCSGKVLCFLCGTEWISKYYFDELRLQRFASVGWHSNIVTLHFPFCCPPSRLKHSIVVGLQTVSLMNGSSSFYSETYNRSCDALYLQKSSRCRKAGQDRILIVYHARKTLDRGRIRYVFHVQAIQVSCTRYQHTEAIQTNCFESSLTISTIMMKRGS